MDPALQELLATGEATDEVAIVLRLREPAELPPGLRIVARFGPIATARIERGAIWQVYGHPAIASLKAPRWLVSEYGPLIDRRDAENIDPGDTDQRRPDELVQRGRGCVVALVDWGLDYAHPDFIDAAGQSRVRALWDQRATVADTNPYGYGRVLRRAELTAAIRSDAPYRTTGYHPAQSDTGVGAHGTHVMSIAAGNGRGGGPVGIAPEADLLFVHLGAPGWEKSGPLGDSSNLLEALHFIVKEAGDRPLVVNMSIGRHAGPHDGTTLVEQAIDWLVRARPGTAVVQSAGNYFARNVHSAGQLMNGEVDELEFEVFVGDTTPNEVEVWYPGRDVFRVGLIAPDGSTLADLKQGDKAELHVGGTRIGTLYHRASDPNNGDHHVNLFLYTSAPAGTWRLRLGGEDVSDGRYHAWVERDPGCRRCQALFVPANANHRATTGSICNGLQTIAVGAYDAHRGEHPLAPFSSSGPTRDGRVRPVLLAPGVRVLAARSHPRTGDAPLLTRMSGTSMAAPHVTGTIALMFEAGGRLDIVQLRRALFDSLAPAPRVEARDRDRVGFGVLDISAAVRSAAELGAGRAPLASRPAPLSLPPAPTGADGAAAQAEGLAHPANQDSAMNAHCCGERCTSCEYCQGHDCASCACCHAPTDAQETFLADSEAVPLEGEAEPMVQVVPSPLAYAAAEYDEPLVQVVPSPLAPRRSQHYEHDATDAIAPEAAETLHPVEVAEALVESGADDPTNFVAQALAGAGRAWPLQGTVRTVYDDLVGRTTAERRLQMDRYFEVVGRPGRVLVTAPASGDLLIRRGESGFAHGAFITHPLLYSEPEARAHGLRTESPWGGLYVHVVEAGHRPQQGRMRFARRVCAADGTVLPDTLLLRPRPAGVEALESNEMAEAYADPNVRWLQLVLNQCISAGLVVDGLMGPATRDAIRRFQQAHGLLVDGIVGPQTLQALRAEGHVPPPGYRPPSYTPPSYAPPSYRPPAYTPPSYAPPSYAPPSQTPPSYAPPSAPLPSYAPPGEPPLYMPPWIPPPDDRPPPPPPDYRPPSQPPTGYPAPPAYRPPGERPPQSPAYPTVRDHRTHDTPQPAYTAPPAAAYPPPKSGPYAAEDENGSTCRELDRFGYDSATLTAEHRHTIDDIAQRLVAIGARSVSVTGYASPEGTDAYNLMLGQRRADAVVVGLRQACERIRHGSAATIGFHTRSEGEARQLAGGGAVNRRVAVCYAETRPAPPPPPPPPPAVMVRYDVASSQGAVMLRRYEEAVRRMMALPPGNPLSWQFQWFTHAVPDDRSKAAALNAVYGPNPSPARTLAERMWSTCRAHFGQDERLFLPWHRAYVYYFERICRRVLQDDSFTLPYWDYIGGSSILPSLFRNPASPLYRANRSPGVNAGQAIDQGQPRLSANEALARPNYAPVGVARGFNDILDARPHGGVHVLVGNERGMGRVPWAAQDPIFWLHHSNIDRLWASWNAAGRRNPTASTWLDARFALADENGQPVNPTSAAVNDVAALGYRYDHLDSVPPAAGAAEAAEAEETEHRRPPMITHATAAPSGGIRLGGNAIKVNLRNAPRGTGEAAEPGTQRRLYLVLRNYRADVAPGILYHVYLALPPGVHGEAAERHYVGPLSFFSAVPHRGHEMAFEGQTTSYDVTDIAERLRAAGLLHERPSVTIVPAGQPAAAAQPVIGEISLVEQ